MAAPVWSPAGTEIEDKRSQPRRPVCMRPEKAALVVNPQAAVHLGIHQISARMVRYYLPELIRIERIHYFKPEGVDPIVSLPCGIIQKNAAIAELLGSGGPDISG